MGEKVVEKIDTENFITEIEGYPTIWNSQGDEYSDRIAKKAAWMKLLTHFIQDFEEKTPAEKKELYALLQKKWKNLRDSYTREVSKQKAENKSGSAAKPRKTYVFYEQLKFLEVTVKKTTSSMDNQRHGGSTNGEDSEVDDSKEVEFPTNRGKKRKKENEDDMLLKCLKSQYLQRQGQDQNDSDRLFLLSLVPELKSVPEHLKLDLKSRIMGMIGQAKQAAHPGNLRNVFQQQHYNNEYQPNSRSGPADFGYPSQRPSQMQDVSGFGQFPPLNVTVPETVASTMYPNLQNNRSYTPLQPVNVSAPGSSPSDSHSLSPSDFEF